MNTDPQRITEYQQALDAARTEIHRVIVGLDDIIEGVLITLLCRGHVLLEGVPGLGKTMLVNTLGQALDLDFSRIQFTPDLMPADITGTNILMEDTDGRRYFEFQKGPLFSQIILADEINRATPKTQSALLEAMQEKTITVAGTSRSLKEPFFVLATQNPLEMEGTYPLPEAQVDRFLTKLIVTYPSIAEMKEILARTTVEEFPRASPAMSADTLREIQNLVRGMPISSEIVDYAVRIVFATQPKISDLEPVKSYVRYGSSPRGAQALILAGKARAFLDGRFNVSYEDIRKVALPGLRHRILLNFEGEAEEIATEDIIEQVLTEIPRENGG